MEWLLLEGQFLLDDMLYGIHCTDVSTDIHVHVCVHAGFIDIHKNFPKRSGHKMPIPFHTQTFLTSALPTIGKKGEKKNNNKNLKSVLRPTSWFLTSWFLTSRFLTSWFLTSFLGLEKSCVHKVKNQQQTKRNKTW